MEIATKFQKSVAALIFLLCASASLRLIFPAPADTQVRPVYDRGAMGLGQLLKRLNTTASALMIGAHPDDEDTALLAYLARGESARTAYLSLTRGDGGQNIIGPELGEALGVIRTEELLQARRLDGAEQFFTRAYDFGFSKTFAEAKQKWDEKIILCDVVRVIRDFRPLVVISQFNGTPTDGHGQHQYAGYISPLAVKAAADPTQCTDAGTPWQVQKFYVRHRGQGEPTLRINTGKYDPLLGRSYFEIAMEARSQHKSQEQGVLELKGDQFSNLSRVGHTTKEQAVFEGLDTSAKGRAAGNPEGSLLKRLAELQSITSRSIEEYNVRSPENLLTTLLAGYKLARDLEGAVQQPLATAMLHQKTLEFREAIKVAAGIQIDAIADKETVVGGEEFTALTRIYFPLLSAIKVKEVLIKSPKGWVVEAAQPPTETQPQFFRRESARHASFFKVIVRYDEKPTEPYWLWEPRDGDIFHWPNDGNQTLPFQPPAVSAEIKLDILGVEVIYSQPLEYRYADDVRGEIRRQLNVVLPVSLDFGQEILIAPKQARDANRTVVVTATNNSSTEQWWNVSVYGPENTSLAISLQREIHFKRRGEKVALPSTVTIPSSTKSGVYEVYAQVSGHNVAYVGRMSTITYPHIQTHRFYNRAETKVSVFDLEVAPVSVGYINGSGDRVPEAIKQLGLNVEEIDENLLATGDLSKFDVIVVGIRAYQVRPDIVANNQRLLDFARNGGTLIVQYQLPSYAQQNLTPFPAQQGPRVVDEDAKVAILQPNHPIFNFPNKITDKDFEGWVQERNLYNFSTMDEKYSGLLESHDAGEAENKGGLVIADIGKGKYIYCSYSMFRQLPAGVPGAYRLLANMVSLPKAKN